MKYVVRHYEAWYVVKQYEGGYTTDAVGKYRWRWMARLRAWWLNRG